MIQIDAPSFQEGLDFFVVTLPAIDRILATIVFVCSSGDDELGIWNDFESIRAGLKQRVSYRLDETESRLPGL